MGGWSREQYLESLQQLESPDDLIPRVVHDLRNRVNGILSVTRLLREDMESTITEEQKLQVLALLQENATDILNIANAVLAYHQQNKPEE